ncbi:MAG: hypothetical protein RIS90_1746 [Pseudomonadota bacterium]|jgi:hypothetical protein
MTIALYAIAKLTAPLHRLNGWLGNTAAPEPAAARIQGGGCPANAPYLRAKNPITTGPEALKHPRIVSRPTLRIERIVESGQRANQAGRMVISGRMADVCAELDRLVAREAALH